MKQLFAALVLVLPIQCLATPDCALEEQDAGACHLQSIADAYYGAFTGDRLLSHVPMADALTFVSPRFKLDNANAFRTALSQLFSRVEGLEIESQVVDDTNVLTFYRLDLGAPQGPVPMAERLSVVDGQIVAVNLLFDSARLPDSR